MRHPAEEWDRAVAELEPLRLEFQMVDRDELRKGTNIFRCFILGVFVLPLVVLAVWQREPLVILPSLVAVSLWPLLVEWNRHRLSGLMPQKRSPGSPTTTVRSVSGSGCGWSRT